MTTFKPRNILSWCSGLPYDNTRFSIGRPPEGGQHGYEWYNGESNVNVISIEYILPNPITESAGNYIIKLEDDRKIVVSEEIPSFIEEVAEE
ncbi:hypothetical protein [Listeria monocytogenes]|uniref:Uncharacterized protein n=1 Tax=Listeria monocytogenes TaxID=1639 RepID=A0A6C8NEK1_LISMN|nr:hypothetical protein [Listeria monocytogenes]KAA9427381.1 hypothetical protein DCK69_00175 [Listeria monocytogenes]KAA9474227.1 hypothetical protein DCK50_15600 [Listeria monocytogenes]KAA9522941.1 hypothetical protein DCK37_14670 [Listeria monocytogenes]KAA9539824.1 hypothetical protein DCK29_05125 [Listeria monocytogenes]KAA9596168.1 hypothetical protein DCK14_05135 [Listeria monocytogenes]